MRLFAAEGAKVVVSDVLVDAGRGVADSLGDGAVFLRHDVSREEDWEAAVNLATERFGGLDVLVNNAGILHNATIAKHTLEATTSGSSPSTRSACSSASASAIAPMTEPRRRLDRQHLLRRRPARHEVHPSPTPPRSTR